MLIPFPSGIRVFIATPPFLPALLSEFSSNLLYRGMLSIAVQGSCALLQGCKWCVASQNIKPLHFLFSACSSPHDIFSKTPARKRRHSASTACVLFFFNSIFIPLFLPPQVFSLRVTILSALELRGHDLSLCLQTPLKKMYPV